MKEKLLTTLLILTVIALAGCSKEERDEIKSSAKELSGQVKEASKEAMEKTKKMAKEGYEEAKSEPDLKRLENMQAD